MIDADRRVLYAVSVIRSVECMELNGYLLISTYVDKWSALQGFSEASSSEKQLCIVGIS